MDSKKLSQLTRKALLAGAGMFLVLAPSALSYTITGGTLTEDFTTLEKADLANSTGLWNVVNNRAQAKAFADAGGATARPIEFGDGSDGVLNVASGTYTFDTNAHPAPYNFVSVDITGGTIQVVGSNPLVIRSLKHVNITPTIDVSGGNGLNGSTVDTATRQPGVSKTCDSRGGTGGAATPATADDGTKAYFMGGLDPDAGAAAGVKNLTAGINAASDGQLTTTAPGVAADFDTVVNGFACGAGGAGGGGQSNGGNFAAGASGGAGGGMIRIAAVGAVSVGNILANGGAGGNGALSAGGGCSGHSLSGGGGSIWLQSLTSTASTLLQANAGGSNVTDEGCGIGPVTFWNGTIREDKPGSALPTNNVRAGTYIVQSKAYDLSVLNADFTGATVAPIDPNVVVEYAGSDDGLNFSSFTTDIASLSNKGYRHLKFRATITVLAAGASPVLNSVQVNYTDLGLEKLGMTLGCGSLIEKNSDADRMPPFQGAFAICVAMLLWLTAYLSIRTAES